MPLLDDKTVRWLLALARSGRAVCSVCGETAPRDYCRTCDLFYLYHPGDCIGAEKEHCGHRLTIVPFVEER